MVGGWDYLSHLLRNTLFNITNIITQTGTAWSPALTVGN